MTGFTLSNLGLLLLLASLVAMLSRRAKLPYSVALVAAGAALALDQFLDQPVGAFPLLADWLVHWSISRPGSSVSHRDNHIG